MDLHRIIDEAVALKSGTGPATSWARERKLAELVIALAEHLQRAEPEIAHLIGIPTTDAGTTGPLLDMRRGE